MVTQTIQDLVGKEGKAYDVCIAIGPMIMMKFTCKVTESLEYSHCCQPGIPLWLMRNRYMRRLPLITVGGEIKNSPAWTDRNSTDAIRLTLISNEASADL